MNKNIGIIVGVIALIVIVGGVYSSMNKKEEMTKKESMQDDSMMKNEKKMMEDDSEVKDDTSMMNEESAEMMKAGSYEEYSADKITRAETGDVVLFFHASWCPSCRGLNSSIESNLSSIPEGVTILKADYDKEVELKKKYGVTTQHTLVQVDKYGNMINKWSGGSTLENLISQIQ